MKQSTLTCSVLLTFALPLAGCSTLAQMMPDSELGQIAARTAEADEAKAPEGRTEFPEAAPMLDSSSKDFARSKQVRLLRAYFTQSGWNVQPEKERSVPVVLFTHEKARGMSQGAEGEEGVCYEHSCAMVQEWGPGWSAPSLDCNTVPTKVSCKSTNALPRS